MDEALRVREYWFGSERVTAASLGRRMAIWFGADDPLERSRRDEEIRAQFGALFARAAAGELDAWADGPRRRLSLILLLDQFPRHLFRGTAQAFEYDDQALALTLSGMQSAADAALEVQERLFFYLPLQHAERLEVQEESVVACRRLRLEAPQALQAYFEDALRYAQLHRDIIARFGRFPHRNQALGRATTAAEEEWLAAAGETFAQ
jgi:uncharacterized protein (DUF924 family)